MFEKPRTTVEPIDISLRMGEKNKKQSAPTEEQIINALKQVVDPDIGVDIYNMGLIYKMDIDKMGDVKVDMTLTSPTCPYAEILVSESGKLISDIQEVGEVFIKLVWEPAWDLSMLSDEARFKLDLL